jgi:signal peptidase II
MRKWPFVAFVVVAVVVVDQLTKIMIRDMIPLHDSIPIIPSLFNLTHVRNPGGAFNLLARSHDTFRVPFFLIMTVVAVMALLYFLREIQSHQRLLLFAVAGVLGGAIGNFIDRVAIGEVTDFLDFYVGSYHWPSFNVADSFISVGVVVLLVHSLLWDRKSEPR